MIKNKNMKTFSEDGDAASVRSRTSSAKGKRRHIAKSNTMSSDTKDFIQKICYRKAASIDMTQYGFIADSKVNPVNYVINPLRVQLEKIRVKPAVLKHRPLPSTSRTNAREVVSPVKLKPSSTSKSVKQQRPLPSPPRIKSRVVVSPPLLCGTIERKPSSSLAHQTSYPKSALSHPGTRSSNACVRKVRIQSEPIPSPVTSKQIKFMEEGYVGITKNREQQEKIMTVKVDHKIVKSY